MRLLLLALAFAQTDAELIAAKKSEVERQATAAVRTALLPICLGRCELLGVDVEVEAQKSSPDAMPGFESIAKVQTRAWVKTLVINVAADQKLSAGTRSGLTQAVQAAVVGLAPTIDVRLRPFDFPEPRNEAVSPIVISMPKSEPEKTPAPQLPPAAPPPSPLERLLGALADASPWLLGMILGFVGIALLVLFCVRLWRSGQAPVAAREAAPPGDASHAHEPAPIPSSPLLLQCKENRALRAAVVRRLLTDASSEHTGPALRLLGEEALLDFHATSLTPVLPRAYGLLRASRESPEALITLEKHIAAELENGEPDPRLYRLQTIEPAVFSAVVHALGEADGRALLLRAPEHLRAEHVRTLAPTAQQAFFSAALDQRTPAGEASPSTLAERVDQAVARLAESYTQAVQAAQLMADQPALLQKVLDGGPLWADVAADLLATEEALLGADDELVDLLILSAPPEALVCFLCGAGPELRLRLQGKLPAYLRALYEADKGRVIAEDEAQRARALVFGEFRRLKRRGGTLGKEVAT